MCAQYMSAYCAMWELWFPQHLSMNRSVSFLLALLTALIALYATGILVIAEEFLVGATVLAVTAYGLHAGERTISDLMEAPAQEWKDYFGQKRTMLLQEVEQALILWDIYLTTLLVFQHIVETQRSLAHHSFEDDLAHYWKQWSTPENNSAALRPVIENHLHAVLASENALQQEWFTLLLHDVFETH